MSTSNDPIVRQVVASEPLDPTVRVVQATPAAAVPEQVVVAQPVQHVVVAQPVRPAARV